MRNATILAACLSVFAGFAHAEQHFPELRKLKEIELLIEDLNRDSLACGITKKLIRDAFMHSASTAKFDVVEDLTPSIPHFYISVLTLNSPEDNICASYIHVGVDYRDTMRLRFSGEEHRVTVPLWNNGVELLTSSRLHGEQIRRDIEKLTKEFVTEWNLQNK